MPYLWSVVLVLAGLVGLGLVVGAVLGPVRRTSRVLAAASEGLGGDGRMLQARIAALRVRLAERSAARSIGGTEAGDDAERSPTVVAGDAAERSPTRVAGDAAERSSTRVAGDAAERSSTRVKGVSA